MQDLTPRALDSLASFGERLSTRMFAAFLRAEGLAAQQYDAWDLGLTSTDDFTNADVLYEPTLARIAAALAPQGRAQQAIPVVTGFLAHGINTGDLEGAPQRTCQAAFITRAQQLGPVSMRFFSGSSYTAITTIEQTDPQNQWCQDLHSVPCCLSSVSGLRFCSLHALCTYPHQQCPGPVMTT